MKKLLLVFICISTLALSFSVSAKELKVGLTELDYPPFYFEVNGEYYGAALEISRAVAEKLGHKLVFIRAPWKRIQGYLRSGEIDMMILYFKSTDRARDVIYTGVSHINESSDLFILYNSDIKFEGRLKELLSYRFGSIRGYFHGTEFANANYLSKDTVSNEEQLIKMLINGRFDIGVGSKSVIIWHAKSLGLMDKIRFLVPPLNIGKNYIVFSKARKNAQDLADEFSNQLRTFLETAEYRAIVHKYNIDSN